MQDARVEYLSNSINGKEQRDGILTKALTKIKFIEMHKMLGVEDLSIFPFRN